MSKEKNAVKDKDTVDKETQKEKSSGRSKVLTVFGIVLCVILVPILIVNVTMIVKSYTNPDEYPSFAGYNLMIVLSPSMEDTIMAGDLIVVKNSEPEDVKGESAEGARDGDIISFFDPDSSKQSVLTHRCKSVTEKDGQTFFITKGDHNMSEDPTPCPAENLIGTYITRIPGAGNIAMWLQTTPGLIVCVAVPIVLLVAYDLIMKKRYDKNKKKDTDALLAELESLRAQQAETDDSAESKAQAADEKAADAQAQKKEEPAQEKKPADEAKAEKAEPEKQEEQKAEEKPAEAEKKPETEKAEEKTADTAEEKAEEAKTDEKPAGENMTTAVMSAEELEEFRQFQEFQKMKKAQQEAAKKDSEPKDEA